MSLNHQQTLHKSNNLVSISPNEILYSTDSLLPLNNTIIHKNVQSNEEQADNLSQFFKQFQKYLQTTYTKQ